MTYQTYDENMMPGPQPNIVVHNTAIVYSWILASEQTLKQRSTTTQNTFDGCWPSIGMFVRGCDLICTDIRVHASSLVTYEMGARIPLVVAHRDGLSVSCNRFLQHLDVEGNCRTRKTALRVAELTLGVLQKDCHLKCGMPLLLFLDTRACELWYCQFFEVYFSCHQSLIKVFFSDVSRRSLCDPNDVEATNSSYERMLASMPPIESVKDVKFKTDNSGAYP